MSKSGKKSSDWRSNVYRPTDLVDKSYVPVSQGGTFTPPQGGTGTAAKPSSQGGGSSSGGTGSQGKD